MDSFNCYCLKAVFIVIYLEKKIEKRSNKNAITNEVYACLRVGCLENNTFLSFPLDTLTICFAYQAATSAF